MAIARVNSAVSLSTASPYSFNAGTSDFIVAYVYTRGATAASAPTWNGASMTQAFTNTLSSTNKTYCWYILGGATGTNNLAWTGGGSNSITVVSYSGCSQTGFPDASTSNNGTLTSPQTATITTIADNCWQIMGFMTADGTTCSASTGATQVQNSIDAGGGTAVFDSNAALTPAGSKSMAITFASTATPRSSWYSFSIAPAAAAATPHFLASMGVGS